MGLNRIVAILSGGDWVDASVEHLSLPQDIDLMEQRRLWIEHNYARVPDEDYVNFVDWLKRIGGREPTDAELTVIEEEA
jgi:hypothetical protein